MQCKTGGDGYWPSIPHLYSRKVILLMFLTEHEGIPTRSQTSKVGQFDALHSRLPDRSGLAGPVLTFVRVRSRRGCLDRG